MQDKSWIPVRMLLNRFHPKTTKDFLSLLPQNEAKKMTNLDQVAADIDSLFINPEEFFKNLHYSWAAPYLQKLPIYLQELVASALPNPLAAGLKKNLNIKASPLPSSSRANDFFVKKLFEQIYPHDILPPGLLPKENLSLLLDLSRRELLQLLDFLGLFDLAEEVRHIVDKKKLQTIYACLDNKKMKFMRMCLHQKSKIAVAKLDLQNWKGDCSSLSQTLHQRGLYRLGKALNGSHPHFLWYLSRKFDTGRSALLEKCYTRQATPGITSAIVQQVLNVINFLKQKSEM